MLDYMIQCRRDLHRIPELEQHSGYTAWVDVCKSWQA